MKRMLLGFIAGLAVGAFAVWYFEDGRAQGRSRLERDSISGAGERVRTTVQEKVGEIRTDDIKRELERAGLVVREKLTKAGAAISDATEDARVTAAIKGKFLKEPGLSSLTISVDTTDGLVTLSGTARSHEEVTRAVRIALDTEGVKKVVSTLQVRPEK
jgi:hyperosmotically inducible periplasmic protein